MRKTRKKYWKDSLAKTRYVMDVWLLIGFILVCAPKATGIVLHEWLSVIYMIPLVIHLLLHWDWITTLPSKIVSHFTRQSLFNAIWDTIFYISTLMVILSGFLVSEAIFPQLGIPLDIQLFWSEVHHTLGNLQMPMLGIHLAMHWKWIKSMSKNWFKGSTKKGAVN